MHASITIGRPAAEVYRHWRDLENLPRLLPHLTSVRVLEGARSHWVARGPGGTTLEWDAELTEDRPDELIAWRSLPGAALASEGRVRFQAAPGGRGTEVHVELRYDPPAGRLGATVSKLTGHAPEQELAAGLRALKQTLETGEVLRSDATLTGARLLQPAAQPRAA